MPFCPELDMEYDPDGNKEQVAVVMKGQTYKDAGLKLSQYPKIEGPLYDKLCQFPRHKVRDDVRKLAQNIAIAANEKNFKPTVEWLDNFMRRFCISRKKMGLCNSKMLKVKGMKGGGKKIGVAPLSLTNPTEESHNAVDESFNHTEILNALGIPNNNSVDNSEDSLASVSTLLEKAKSKQNGTSTSIVSNSQQSDDSEKTVVFSASQNLGPLTEDGIGVTERIDKDNDVYVEGTENKENGIKIEGDDSSDAESVKEIPRERSPEKEIINLDSDSEEDKIKKEKKEEQNNENIEEVSNNDNNEEVSNNENNEKVSNNEQKTGESANIMENAETPEMEVVDKETTSERTEEVNEVVNSENEDENEEEETNKDSKEDEDDDSGSTSKSNSDSENSDNDSDLVVKSKSWEERNFVEYDKTEDLYYEEHDTIVKRKLEEKLPNCTACYDKVNHNIQAEIFTHPVLGVLLCKKCAKFYGRGSFQKDAEGYDEYCRWCANGGDLLLCDHCTNGFCKKCIKRNVGRTAERDAIKSKSWECYVCNLKPLRDVRALHRAVLEQIRSISILKKSFSRREKKDFNIKQRFSALKLKRKSQGLDSGSKEKSAEDVSDQFARDVRDLCISCMEHLEAITKRKNKSSADNTEVKARRRLWKLADVMEKNFARTKLSLHEVCGDSVDDAGSSEKVSNKIDKNSEEDKIIEINDEKESPKKGANEPQAKKRKRNGNESSDNDNEVPAKQVIMETDSEGMEIDNGVTSPHEESLMEDDNVVTSPHEESLMEDDNENCLQKSSEDIFPRKSHTDKDDNTSNEGSNDDIDDDNASSKNPDGESDNENNIEIPNEDNNSDIIASSTKSSSEEVNEDQTKSDVVASSSDPEISQSLLCDVDDTNDKETEGKESSVSSKKGILFNRSRKNKEKEKESSDNKEDELDNKDLDKDKENLKGKSILKGIKSLLASDSSENESKDKKKKEKDEDSDDETVKKKSKKLKRVTICEGKSKIEEIEKPKPRSKKLNARIKNGMKSLINSDSDSDLDNLLSSDDKKKKKNKSSKKPNSSTQKRQKKNYKPKPKSVQNTLKEKQLNSSIVKIEKMKKEVTSCLKEDGFISIDDFPQYYPSDVDLMLDSESDKELDAILKIKATKIAGQIRDSDNDADSESEGSEDEMGLKKKKEKKKKNSEEPKNKEKKKTKEGLMDISIDKEEEDGEEVGEEEDEEIKKKGFDRKSMKALLMSSEDEQEEEEEEEEVEDLNDSTLNSTLEKLTEEEIEKKKKELYEKNKKKLKEKDKKESESENEEIAHKMRKKGFFSFKFSSSEEEEEEEDGDDSEKESPRKARMFIESDSDFETSKKKKKKNDLFSSSENDDDSDEESSSDDSSKKDKKSKSRKRIKRPSSSTEEEDGGGGEGEGDGKDDAETPSKKRRRHIIRDEDLLQSTKDATQEEKERRDRVKERQLKYNKIFEIDVENDQKDQQKMVLDFDEKTNKELVVVHEKLVSFLKPHQITGIRFMWDATIENVERLEKGEKGGGSILAHCMGLGKTLQVIAFIHTLLTNRNVNQKISRVMVCCPVNTVYNWVAEFKNWLKGKLDVFDVVELISSKDLWARAYKLDDWYKEGGVCIIGYDMFRNLSNANNKRYKGSMRDKFQRCLVDPGPDMMVCDEGHILKNEKTALSIAINKIKTFRRIVLTGTPLQNNLKEYHCMIQFVKPNLLGSKKEFMNRFVNPIEAGQCMDALPRDVRRMKRRAHILHNLLEGCVQRFDYSVLKPFLPPKYEYVVSVQMCDVQCKLYDYYLKNLAQGGPKRTGSGLFVDFNNLSRIWSHPVVLFLALRRRELKGEDLDDEDDLDGFIDDSDTSVDSSEEDKPKKKKKKKNEDDNEVVEVKEKTDEENKPEEANKDENERIPGLTSEGKVRPDWWRRVMEEMGGEKYDEDDFLNRIEISGKLYLLFDILRESCSIGDKVLLFSQSILVLDMIEEFLRMWDAGEIAFPPNNVEQDKTMPQPYTHWKPDRDYYRLDGSTSADIRKNQCKSFNSTTNERCRLFLISTRAGGVGINLVAANRVIIFDSSWNPSHDTQSIFRVYRFGQKKPCYIYRFVAQGTMEEKIYSRQVTKISTSLRVVDEHQIKRYFNMAELSELYQFTPADIDIRETPVVPEDRLLAELLIRNKNYIVKYHEQDSLLENQTGEELTEEERNAAWEDYENEKKGVVPQAQRYQAGMSIPTNVAKFDIEQIYQSIVKANPQATSAQIYGSVNLACQQIQKVHLSQYQNIQGLMYNLKNPMIAPEIMRNMQIQDPNELVQHLDIQLKNLEENIRAEAKVIKQISSLTHASISHSSMVSAGLARGNPAPGAVSSTAQYVSRNLPPTSLVNTSFKKVVIPPKKMSDASTSAAAMDPLRLATDKDGTDPAEVVTLE